MANKRMFTMKIVDSDAFLDMPLSTQCLYFHLNMRADDDGFIGNPNKVMRIIGASQDDLKLLIAKRFVLSFEDGVIVIKHWRMHNTLSQNRYQETQYLEEKSALLLKENGSYSFNSGTRIDDTLMIEASKRQVRRTKDAQKTHPDKDKDKDIDIDIDIDKDKDKNSLKKTKAKESEIDFEKLWVYTFECYKKHTSPAVAKQVWMDIILSTPEESRFDIAKLIWKATEAYLADYEKNNPNDKEFRYIPKYSEWLKDYSAYWIEKVEKEER